MSTRSAPESTIRSIPTPPSRRPRACPRSSCTARPRSRWPCPAWWRAISRAIPVACAASPCASPAWSPCRRASWCAAAPCRRAASPSTPSALTAAPSWPTGAWRGSASLQQEPQPKARRRCDQRGEPAIMKQMTRRERIAAAINREPVDRVPYALWRHFPAVDRSPAGLAQATLRFHDHYGSDFLQITPRGGYCVEAWGCVESEQVLANGNRACASCAVKTADDWRRIRPLDPASAAGWVEQLETIVRLGFDRRIGDAPVVATVFSPLSIARKLSGDRLAADLRERPDAVAGAVDAIGETVLRFNELALAEGIGGIFYSIQAASGSVVDEETYARFGY